MPEFETEMTVTIGKAETEISILAEFDYQPFEPTIIHPVDSAHEGCPESVQVTTVYADGDDITKFLRGEMIAALETEILENRSAA